MNVGDALRRVAKVYPEKVAVIDKFGKYCPVDSRYTYKEVNDKVNRKNGTKYGYHPCYPSYTGFTISTYNGGNPNPSLLK